jgi:hypothetical protein
MAHLAMQRFHCTLLLECAPCFNSNMQVSVDHRPGVKVNVWGLDARTPQQFKFKLKGSNKETTVAEYFRSTYPQLQFKHLHDWPCVMVSQSGAAVPLELCR